MVKPHTCAYCSPSNTPFNYTSKAQAKATWHTMRVYEYYFEKREGDHMADNGFGYWRYWLRVALEVQRGVAAPACATRRSPHPAGTGWRIHYCVLPRDGRLSQAYSRPRVTHPRVPHRVIATILSLIEYRAFLKRRSKGLLSRMRRKSSRPVLRGGPSNGP